MGETLRKFIVIGLMLFGWFLIFMALLDLLLSFLGIIDIGEGHQLAVLIGLVLSAYPTYTLVYLPFTKTSLAQRLYGKYSPVFNRACILLSAVYRKTTPVVEYVFYPVVAIFSIGSLWGAMSHGAMFPALLFVSVLAVALLAASFFNSVKIIVLFALVYFVAVAESPAGFVSNAAMNLGDGLWMLITNNISGVVAFAALVFIGPYLVAAKTDVHTRIAGKVLDTIVTVKSVTTVIDSDLFRGVQYLIILMVLFFVVVSIFKVLLYGANIIVLPLAVGLLYLDYKATRSNSDKYIVSGKIRGFVVSAIGV